MNPWVALYGVCISLMCVATVVMMMRTVRTMRRHLEALHAVTTHLTCAASNMWDTLTPEQIRTLHPNTVEVGNGVPSWDEIREAMQREEPA